MLRREVRLLYGWLGMCAPPRLTFLVFDKKRPPFDALSNLYQTDAWSVRYARDHSHCTDRTVRFGKVPNAPQSNLRIHIIVRCQCFALRKRVIKSLRSCNTFQFSSAFISFRRVKRTISKIVFSPLQLYLVSISIFVSFTCSQSCIYVIIIVQLIHSCRLDYQLSS